MTQTPVDAILAKAAAAPNFNTEDIETVKELIALWRGFKVLRRAGGAALKVVIGFGKFVGVVAAAYVALQVLRTTGVEGFIKYITGGK